MFISDLLAQPEHQATTRAVASTVTEATADFVVHEAALAEFLGVHAQSREL